MLWIVITIKNKTIKKKNKIKVLTMVVSGTFIKSAIAPFLAAESYSSFCDRGWKKEKKRKKNRCPGHHTMRNILNAGKLR